MFLRIQNLDKFKTSLSYLRKEIHTHTHMYTYKILSLFRRFRNYLSRTYCLRQFPIEIAHHECSVVYIPIIKFIE